ncbi:protein FAM180A [Lampris incognitus]|uniref:protein FAM180A n=1 Tax=Lampris incognitus TaxID=2546036 RepID=UPI0024B557D6|nr:protein FAM180A [Lampris incognitus]
MLPWKVMVFCLFYSCIHTCDTQRRNKALFPSVRVKRGMLTMLNPTFLKAIDDVNLLFEILLSGLQFGDSSRQFSVNDAELASFRKTRKLEVICEEIVPRKLTDIRKLTAHLSNHFGHLHQEDFERTLLTLVYTTQQLVNSTTNHQRDIWAESFVSLFKAIKQDLTGTE